LSILAFEFGVQSPLNENSVLVSISSVIIGLSILAYVRDKDSSEERISIDFSNSVTIGFVISLLLLTIVGVQLQNSQGTGLLLMICIAIVGGLFVIVGTQKSYNPRNLPILLFGVTLILLYHSSLISDDIWGFDVNIEYFLANKVVQTGLWDPSIPITVNGMLSVTIIGPFFKMVCDTSLVWTIKAIYPLFFALVPLGLYHIFEKQFGRPRIAFFAAIFFISLFTYYTTCLAMIRLEISELYIVLFLVVFFGTKPNPMQKSALLVIFVFCLVISHYATAFFFIAVIIFAATFLTIERGFILIEVSKKIPLRMALLFIVIAMIWYTYVTSGATLKAGIFVLRGIQDSFINEFMSQNSGQGLSLLTYQIPTLLHNLGRAIQVAAQVIIVVGLVVCFVTKCRTLFDRRFTAFGAASLLILSVALVSPAFAESLSTERIYQMNLIFIAPFFVVGFAWICGMRNSLNKHLRTSNTRRNWIKYLSVFLVLFLFFNSGLLYQIANDNPTSISIDSRLDYPHYSYSEISGAQWLNDNLKNAEVFADYYRFQLMVRLGLQFRIIGNSSSQIPLGSLIYVGTYNINTQEILAELIQGSANAQHEYRPMGSYLANSGRVLDNGGCWIYHTND